MKSRATKKKKIIFVLILNNPKLLPKNINSKPADKTFYEERFGVVSYPVRHNYLAYARARTAYPSTPPPTDNRESFVGAGGPREKVLERERERTKHWIFSYSCTN